jgi:lysophospholipase L1-like esterase
MRVWLAVFVLLGCTPAATPRDVTETAPPPPALDDRLDEVLAALPAAEDDGLTRAVSIEGPREALVPLRRALARIVEDEAEGLHQARIAMLGSSHVGGDLVSGFLRQRLQRVLGDAGHGFVMAVPPYGDYWQSGVFVAEGEGWEVVEPSPKFLEVGAYGPIQIAFDAAEPAFAELGADGATRIDLFYLRQPGGGELTVEVDGARHVLDTSAATLEAGIEVIGVPDGAHHVRLEADGTRPVRIFGAAFEHERDGVLVDQLGLNATTAWHLLQNDALTQRTFWAARRADLFVLWLGTNEASEIWSIELQRERFTAAIERLRDAWPRAGCLVLGPLDRRQHDPEGRPFVPPALHPIARMQREVALELGCAYYDSLAWQHGEGAVERFLDAGLMRPDRVHLTDAGYRRYAADLTRALIEAVRP